MKALVDIFKVDDVKKYVELKNEANRLELDTAIRKTLANNELLIKLARDAADENIDIIKEAFIKKNKAERLEFVTLIVNIIKMYPKDERENFIEEYLPLTKGYFLKIFDDIDDNNP